MKGTAARTRLAEVAKAGRDVGVAGSRADRLAMRIAGRSAPRPRLDEVRQWPVWPGQSDAERQRIWRMTALVAARDSLPDLIDGEVLRAYAACVGEAAFEAVLALPGGGMATLSPPSALDERGRALAYRALPSVLAEALGVACIGDVAANGAVSHAERVAWATAA